MHDGDARVLRILPADRDIRFRRRRPDRRRRGYEAPSGRGDRLFRRYRARPVRHEIEGNGAEIQRPDNEFPADYKRKGRDNRLRDDQLELPRGLLFSCVVQ